MLKAKRCKKGQEQYEKYIAHNSNPLYQYDYRSEEGELFSCVGHSLEECRRKKDRWLLLNPRQRKIIVDFTNKENKKYDDRIKNLWKTIAKINKVELKLPKQRVDLILKIKKKKGYKFIHEEEI